MNIKSKNFLVNSIIIFLILSTFIISTMLALSQIKVHTQNNILKSLQTVNQTTQEALQIWVNYLNSDLIDITYEKEILDLTQSLIIKNNNHTKIVNSTPLLQFRSVISSKLRKHKINDYMLIAPNRINIATRYDENIGNLNNIHKQRKDYLDRAFAGETIFIPTIQADVPLKTSSGDYSSDLPTIFIASPIFNASRKVIAVLAIRLDPSKDFTRIMQLGRIGESGETYAFDSNGILITESRFDYQLRQAGLMYDTHKSILTIRITDPGGNLLEGFKPIIPPEKRSLTVMAQSAIAKNTNYNIDGYRDYRGVNVLGVWHWNERFGFGITTEINADEALRPYYKTRLTIIILLSLSILLSFSMLFFLLGFGKKTEVK